MIFNEETSTQAAKQSHSTIRFTDIIEKGLTEDFSISGLSVIFRNQKFGVKWKTFLAYYRRIGKTSSKDDSIKNRFIKSPNNMKRYHSKVFNQDFDAIYIIPKNIILNISKEVSDEEAVKLLINPEMIVDDDHFNIDDFIKRLFENSPELFKNENYKLNVKLILQSEIEDQANSKETITLSSFNSLLKKFGPLENFIFKVLDFVNSGAKEWYHGRISREMGETILKQKSEELLNQELFLIRSIDKTIDGRKAVFVVSIYSPPSTIEHIPIYINPYGRYYMLSNKQEIMLISPIDFIQYKKQMPKGIPSKSFQQLFQEQKTCSEDKNYYVINLKSTH